MVLIVLWCDVAAKIYSLEINASVLFPYRKARFKLEQPRSTTPRFRRTGNQMRLFFCPGPVAAAFATAWSSALVT
jgi:hypothetical protein